MSNLTESVTRRNWLTGCARGAVLSGMGVATGLLFLRGQVQTCALPADHCPGCAEWHVCSLPAALLARRDNPSNDTPLEPGPFEEVQS